LEALRKALEGKLARRTESYTAEISSLNGMAWDEALCALNVLIKRHNAETDNFKKRLDDNFAKIETHFLSAIVKEVKSATLSIEAVGEQIKVCRDGDAKADTLGLVELEKRIRENRAKISNSQQAATDLSQKLGSFLGRDDLKFEPEGEGYRIMRFGRAAKRLSEGEKTAITFLYFVVGLGDQDFNLSEGIVVIDDPISSLDSSSVYQAFSYLKNAVKDAKQVFLLTHNFEFLKLLLDWLTYGNQKDKSYWMLHCSNTEVGVRETELKPLDKVLTENRNELIFLFRILVNFKSDGTIANSYPIPNIARKVLESFLDQHSSGKSFHKKLENLVYDEQKKASLYKYTNDLSHPTLSGLDPALVGETQTNVKHLLEMIKAVAPVHYDALTATIGT
jgi:wobble nucleotide-excising tRNase